MSSTALPYHEPGIVDILILSSFLLLLNVVNSIIDRYLFCGLIGQILIGIAWGIPGAAWLSIPLQETITQLGYFGLLLLVFEGGLSTSCAALKSNLLLSVAVASTGIVMPMALSFSLIGIANATPLQAFAAGAALCSTSLGTTFTLLSSSGLVTSRLGVVLSSAAMLDDVVGLVMVQIISNLGTSSSFRAMTVVRPILVSTAFAILVPAVCVFILKPFIHSTSLRRQRSIPKWVQYTANRSQRAFIVQVLLLIAFVAAANYAGTSNLFTAYLAGATISWWDSENAAAQQTHKDDLNIPVPNTASVTDRRNSHSINPTPEQFPTGIYERTEKVMDAQLENDEIPTGSKVYIEFFGSAVHRILKPFFFASIGFSIPISKMFSGSILWRGILYSILMTVGKLACSLWVLPLREWLLALRTGKPSSKRLGIRDLYPFAILGSAMVARGEIGFLISSIAESEGIFAADKGSQPSAASDLFLIVSWAIVLCTIIGPICVGLCIRQIQSKMASQGTDTKDEDLDDAWGIWGVKKT